MDLYWVSTEDHDEDWFVLANDPFEAEQHFENYEGYVEGEAMAEYIMEIPGHIEQPDPDKDEDWAWPSHEFLEACGATFLRNETPRVVEINGRRFSEGMLEHTIRKLEDDKFEAMGEGRPNQTEPEQVN